MMRWVLIVVSLAMALAVFYPMVQAAWAGDSIALFFAAVVVVAVGGNLFATYKIVQKQRREAEQHPSPER